MITCPFCQETGFDRIGLKMHIFNEWCYAFNSLTPDHVPDEKWKFNEQKEEWEALND